MVSYQLRCAGEGRGGRERGKEEARSSGDKFDSCLAAENYRNEQKSALPEREGRGDRSRRFVETRCLCRIRRILRCRGRKIR